MKRYIRALEKCEEWLNITLPRNILMIDKLEEYYEALNIIKEVPNFKEINYSHGHGDLSAALTLYQ